MPYVPMPVAATRAPTQKGGVAQQGLAPAPRTRVIVAVEEVVVPGGTQTIFPDGIASAESVGAVGIQVVVSPTGIASAEALGTPTVNQAVSVTGIASAQALGSPTINQALSVTGIASAGALGAPRTQITASPTGVPSAEALGTPTVSATVTQTVVLPGIPTAAAVGDVTVARLEYLLVSPVEYDMPLRVEHRTALDRIGTPEPFTAYRIAGVWASGRDVRADLIDLADRVYRGGYENVVADADERAALVALGYAFTTRTVI